MPPHIEAPITSGFQPHVRWMAELVNSPTNTLNVTWEVFQDADPSICPEDQPMRMTTWVLFW